MKNSVQLTILSLLAIAVTTSSAFADFRPGRVRAGTVSDMRTVSSSGSFDRLSGARVEMNYQDGKAKPVSFTLKVEGSGAVVLPILNVSPSTCGDVYRAAANGSNRMTGISLELVDYSNIKCRIFVANKWHVTVESRDEQRQKSEWKLEGQPEHLVGTLTTRVQ